VGSAAALPLALLLRPLPAYAFIAFAVAISLLGIWASDRSAAILGEEDPQSVVIDEVAGVLLALCFVQNLGPGAWAMAWSLFRVLDISKPGPIDRIQYLKPAGVGIMADDILAGLAAGAIALALTLAFPVLGL
jgi:phosphatidylglycerophosphatase A